MLTAHSAPPQSDCALSPKAPGTSDAWPWAFLFVLFWPLAFDPIGNAVLSSKLQSPAQLVGEPHPRSLPRPPTPTAMAQTGIGLHRKNAGQRTCKAAQREGPLSRVRSRTSRVCFSREGPVTGQGLQTQPRGRAGLRAGAEAAKGSCPQPGARVTAARSGVETHSSFSPL